MSSAVFFRISQPLFACIIDLFCFVFFYISVNWSKVVFGVIIHEKKSNHGDSDFRKNGQLKCNWISGSEP